MRGVGFKNPCGYQFHHAATLAHVVRIAGTIEKEKTKIPIQAPKPLSESAAKPLIRFENKESKDFRTIHADGAFGGPTPTGDIAVFFFNQFFQIDPVALHYFEPQTGRVGQQIEESSPKAGTIQRNVEAAVVMNVTVARGFYEWLGKTLEKVAEGGERENVP